MESYEARISSAALIKKVLPTNEAKNDTILSVQTFEKNDLKGGDLYLGEAKALNRCFGHKRLITLQPVLGGLVNPIGRCQGFQVIR